MHTERNKAMTNRIPRRIAALAAAATAVCCLAAAAPSLTTASAAPTGNQNWITLDATCNGQPVQLLDPRGGNTAFTVGGSVGVGKLYQWTDMATGQVLAREVKGAQ